jgi:hypothetical protein
MKTHSACILVRLTVVCIGSPLCESSSLSPWAVKSYYDVFFLVNQSEREGNIVCVPYKIQT